MYDKINAAILGEISSGKTYSLRTIITSVKKELFVLATEPGIDRILGDIPCSDGCHWHYVSPAKTEWDVLIANAKLSNTSTMSELQKMPGMNKHHYTQFIEVLGVCNEFICDRCEENFGDIEEWGPERVFAIDGLTGLSDMGLALITGAKPINSLPEFLCAQTNLMFFIKKLVSDLKCSFVLISHVAKKEDRITGGTHLTFSSIGQAISEDIPKPFDEVIYAERKNEDDFYWSTIKLNAALKTRSLPFKDEISPDFALLFKEKEGD